MKIRFIGELVIVTLVVARNLRGRIAIVSDTMLTEHGRALPHQQGIIKSSMLPGGLCVSFANSPELAARDFKKFSAKNPQGASFADAVTFFEQSSSNTGNDYILAFSSSPRLVKISDGKRMPSVAETQWIGDASAYTRFREYESKQLKKMESGRAINAVLFADEIDGSPASDLYSTMRHIIADPKINSAGGFACVVSSRGEHFRHSVYSDMLYNWPEKEGDDFILTLEDQIEFGASGENSGYAIAQISTGFLGMNVVAFYLLKGRKLFVFHGDVIGVSDKCLVLTDVAPSDIVPKLNEAFRLNLNWLAIVTSSPPADTKTTRRHPLLTEGPKGVSLAFVCHVNTLSSS